MIGGLLLLLLVTEIGETGVFVVGRRAARVGFANCEELEEDRLEPTGLSTGVAGPS